MTPKITVLMPVYNGAKYIGEAITSVLNQTFTDFELLIVNDGSTDATEQIIKSYTDPRIRLFSQNNGGVSSALNTGLKQAKGKYIARFDADDICYPNRLETQYTFMEAHPDYILIGSDADYMTEEGDYLFTYENIGHTNEEIHEKIATYCPFVHCSVFYLKDVVLALGGYDINAHTFEDYLLWTRLIKIGKVCNFKQPLIRVRYNSSSVTVDEKDREPIFKELKKKALQTGKITEAEGQLLLTSIKKLSAHKKESSYLRLLGKKYLWNNYQPRQARSYLIRSLRWEPFKLNTYLLIIFSFFPENLIKRIYKKNKT